MSIISNDGINLFGFQIKRKKDEIKKDNLKSFVAPTDDGESTVINAGGYYGSFLNVDVDIHAEKDLIMKYRDIAQQPECDNAIEDIISSAVISDDDSSPVQLILDDLDVSDSIKKKILDEFDKIIELLNFNWCSHEIFRRWYVDGRLYFHKIIDDEAPKKGIQELRFIDSTKIKKIKEIEEEIDPKTKVNYIKSVKEFYIFQDNDKMATAGTGVKIHPDSIAFVTSGVVDPQNKLILSHLHKALKPTNQLRMMEDAIVIYRISRAPERRIFYIDVGNLPKGKAEEYMRNIMAKYRNKMVYDAQTGELRNDRKHMSMLEDFWLPRRSETGRGTEITTLPSGQNLSDIEDILYFKQRLYKSLNVPMSRLEAGSAFSIGRSTEITRDELKFNRFINRLRKRFSILFIDLLKTQLILKGIILQNEWDAIAQKINIDFIKDNHFAELKDAELLQDRLSILRDIQEYEGKYFSTEWIRKNVLMQNDQDIEVIDKQIGEERNKFNKNEDEE